MPETKVTQKEINQGIYVQSITTNALTPSQVTVRGWGYTSNSGTGSNSITITIPQSGFDDATYDVFVTYLGEKSGAAPTSRADRDAFKSSAVASVDATTYTATQFKLNFNAGSGGGNLTQVIFSWMAIGTKA